MNRTLLRFVAAAAVLGLAAAKGPALAQSSDEIQALKREIEALKDGQATMQKNLEEILSILEPIKRRAQAQKFEPKHVDLAGAPRKGSAEAPVTLVEFTDYQCPFCRRHFQNTMPQLLKDYVETGKLRYAVMEFPIPSLHPGAAKAAEGALCAGEQDRYWEMHDAIFQNPRAVAPEQLKDKAAELGLDLAAFSDCLDRNKYGDQVSASVAQGQKLGVNGTPSFVVGRTDPENPDKFLATGFIRGAQGYPAFKQAIDALLAEPNRAPESGTAYRFRRADGFDGGTAGVSSPPFCFVCHAGGAQPRRVRRT